MDAKTRNALKKVIEHFYYDEKKHWEKMDKPEHNHIFHELNKLRDYLDTL